MSSRALLTLSRQTRSYVGMRCRTDCGRSECQCKFDRAWEERNRALSRRSDVFHRSSYWGRWSRVLTPYSQTRVLELNLTAINGYKFEWEQDVRPIVFRDRCTALDRRDELVEALPDSVRDYMAANIGSELTERLLTTDWLPLLNMQKVRDGRIGGGGLSFAECARS